MNDNQQRSSFVSVHLSSSSLLPQQDQCMSYHDNDGNEDDDDDDDDDDYSYNANE